MSDYVAPGHSDDQRATSTVQDSVPAMPAIGESEKYQSSIPFPLVDGLPRTIGWQWHRAAGTAPRS